MEIKRPFGPRPGFIYSFVLSSSRAGGLFDFRFDFHAGAAPQCDTTGLGLPRLRDGIERPSPPRLPRDVPGRARFGRANAWCSSGLAPLHARRKRKLTRKTVAMGRATVPTATLVNMVAAMTKDRSDLIHRARRQRGNWRGLHSATFQFWRIAWNPGCNLNGMPLALVLFLQHAATHN